MKVIKLVFIAISCMLVLTTGSKIVFYIIRTQTK